MTNDEVRNLTPGDRIRAYLDGRVSHCTVTEIVSRGTCTNERSKAFGHWWAQIRCAGTTFSISSDDYENADYNITHDNNGQRVYGWELDNTPTVS